MTAITTCYFVDAFADKVFEGNPAGVCVLKSWPSDELMQNIASENNLSETAFTVKEGDTYRLRWFTPTEEVDLCGHATLATAFVLGSFFEPDAEVFRFNTRSGLIEAHRDKEFYRIDFPAYELVEVPVTDEMEEVIGMRPEKAYMGRDLLCVIDDENHVAAMNPDMNKLRKLDGLLLQVTAKGSEYMCVPDFWAQSRN